MSQRLTNQHVKRICYCCGSDKTYLIKGKQENWFLNHDSDDNVLCKKCYDRLISNPRWNRLNRKNWNKRNSSRRIQFKLEDKQILLRYDPRIGVCNYCRAVRGVDCKKTHLHHDNNKYDISNPLLNTIELCPTCHALETRKLDRQRFIESLKV